MKFENLNNCLNSLKNKKIILLINEKNSECNGCMIYPGQYITNEVINFMNENSCSKPFITKHNNNFELNNELARNIPIYLTKNDHILINNDFK